MRCLCGSRSLHKATFLNHLARQRAVADVLEQDGDTVVLHVRHSPGPELLVPA